VRRNFSYRAGMWLLMRFGGPNAEVMMGDIEERVGPRWSAAVYWKEIAAAVVASRTRRNQMKRVVIRSAVVLTGVLGRNRRHLPGIHTRLARRFVAGN
jgi:hypothetical protein